MVEQAKDPFELQLIDLIAMIETGREPACTMAYSQRVIEVIEGSIAQLKPEERLSWGGSTAIGKGGAGIVSLRRLLNDTQLTSQFCCKQRFFP